jgi:2-oxoglutarate dehydrogenase E1 component
MALDYRETFNKDVVVDVVCFRRYGHNEGDEPYFTQPQMYDRIRKRPPLNVVYSQKLLEKGVIRKEDTETLEQNINRNLEEAFEAVKSGTCIFPQYRFYENWKNFNGNYTHDPVKTGVSKQRLTALARKLNTVPKGFSLNEKLVRLMKKRQDNIEEGDAIDWASAEVLAFASLLTEGNPIRLSGQDSARGTFSQRHSILFDTQTGDEYIPLNALKMTQAPFLVYNSLLSESGVLGFEYGYSAAQPRGLVIWEAQFGDFANNAQSVIDLYIASGQAKWQRLSGLVLLLPHGWEGLGPEHSSARLERFLQLCANDNIQVCNLTTPAQYFHLLRRQAKESYRKPLIIMTPKSLLRHPLAVSELKELTSGEFREVLEDPDALTSARCVLFCSGKIYYELLQKRRELKKNDFAIVRLEQFYPFPEKQIKTVLQKYKKARRFVCVQEEPENMGAWHFLRFRLENIVGKPMEYVGRDAAATTATGYPGIYRKEQAAVTINALGVEASNDK